MQIHYHILPFSRRTISPNGWGRRQQRKWGQKGQLCSIHWILQLMKKLKLQLLLRSRIQLSEFVRERLWIVLLQVELDHLFQMPKELDRRLAELAVDVELQELEEHRPRVADRHLALALTPQDASLAQGDSTGEPLEDWEMNFWCSSSPL